jgi:hypothetical protein
MTEKKPENRVLKYHFKQMAIKATGAVILTSDKTDFKKNNG